MTSVESQGRKALAKKNTAEDKRNCAKTLLHQVTARGIRNTGRENWCANVDLLCSPSPSVKSMQQEKNLLLNRMNRIIL